MNSQSVGDVLPAPVIRHRPPRRRWTAACALVAAIFLTGCTDEPSDPGTSQPPQTPAPEQATGSGPSPAPESSEASPDATSTASGQWGRYNSRSEACTAVAANVVAVAVLPMSLNLSGDAREIDNAEDEIAKMKRSAPEALKADFARVQLLIDTFGERVAAGERGGGRDSPVEGKTEDGNGNEGGSDDDGDDGDGGDGDDGTVQVPPPDASDGSEEPEFNSEALQDALDPIKRWLTKNCDESARS